MSKSPNVPAAASIFAPPKSAKQMKEDEKVCTWFNNNK